MKTHKILLGKICFKFRYNRSFNVFLVFFIFLAWLVPPCCGVGVSNAPLIFE
ncbi:hypothetical protein HMPREF1436_01744 [Helicobacter pylori GAMchJs136i]|nr:hypothetical protein HMPREF1436_01744 [Helicobacter pylori GAMchJs136i]